MDGLGDVGRGDGIWGDILCVQWSKNRMNTLKMFMNALKAGETLNNPKAGKDVQDIINSFGSILFFLLWIIQKFGIDLVVSGTDIDTIAQGFAVLFMAISNWYFIRATTKKKGFGEPDKIEGVGD